MQAGVLSLIWSAAFCCEFRLTRIPHTQTQRAGRGEPSPGCNCACSPPEGSKTPRVVPGSTDGRVNIELVLFHLLMYLFSRFRILRVLINKLLFFLIVTDATSTPSSARTRSTLLKRQITYYSVNSGLFFQYLYIICIYISCYLAPSIRLVTSWDSRGWTPFLFTYLLSRLI